MEYDVSDVDFRTNRKLHVLDFTMTEIAYNRESSLNTIVRGPTTLGMILQKIETSGSIGRQKR